MNNPIYCPHFKILNLIISSRFLYDVTYLLVLGNRADIFGGGQHYSALPQKLALAK
jgi:hypothetical protein